MATYNGATFLREQLDSLVTQTHAPCELVVCDDGSTDGTIEIIKKFSESATFPVRLHQNERNLGYSENFLKAARLCEGDWVAFCDQDDVWLPNKLEDARWAIEREARSIMFLQNAYICDKHLNHEGRLFPNWLRQGYYAPFSQYGFWVWPGFLKTIRADVFSIGGDLEKPRSYFPNDSLQTHDKWTCMIANTIGGFQVIEGAAALYRRHEKALTGAHAPQTFAVRLRKSLPVSAEHYQFLSGVAKETAAYLNSIAEHVEGEKKRCLERGVQSFARIARIQNTRAELYSAESFSSRAKRSLQILAMGGYVGPRSFALGWKSGAKDMLRVLNLYKYSGPEAR